MSIQGTRIRDNTGKNWFHKISKLIFLLVGVFSLRQSRAEDTRRAGDRAANYQAIQEEKKGGDKKQTAEITRKLDSSFVVYEIRSGQDLKFVKIF